jgi:Mg-chelatase subunit ChlI
MAQTDGREGQEGSSRNSDPSVVDAIKAVAAHNARADLDSEKQLTLFLQSWWSRTYNRPLKDPLLLSYSLEELLYEFYDKIERRAAEEERSESNSVKIEEDKEKADLDWAEQEEKRELEALKAKASQEESKSTQDPTKDPANIKWMQEQMEQGKKIFGESFGDDIEEDFE